MCIRDRANQATGDAISNLLMCEVCLNVLNILPAAWSAFYTDLPSQMSKIHVKDKSLIKTTYDETKVVSPPHLQGLIDEIIAKFSGQQARAFIRPSGTEDVVRLYVEASTPATVKTIASEITAAILADKTIN
eukprot:TRINITY_DN12874_c0_g1_i3.p1 TRINITY_DN12874_c0_g1~~TRINITY_DN12874_c0_g1_i3.p1  ORF type:complete len:152 (+),score=38.91 TRINITY_DN12874_c0_g1_i3:61-456(+)